MKKILTILAATAALFSGLMFTGCTEEDKDALMGPENVWCNMPVSYKNTDESTAASLYVYCIYTSTGLTGTNTSGTALKNGLTIPAGITFVVTAKTDASSVISGLTNNAYILKTFPLNQTATYDGDDSSSGATGSVFTANRAWWTGLYYLKSDLRQSANQSVNPPSVLSNDSNATALTWDSVKSQFSWKKLLAAYLLQ